MQAMARRLVEPECVIQQVSPLMTMLNFMANHSRPVVALLILVGLVGCKHNQPLDHTTRPPRLPPPVPAVKPTPIDAALQSQARQELDSALQSSDEIIRAHALEVVRQVSPADAGRIVVAALGDSSPLVQKAAALVAGELQLQQARDRLNTALDGARLSERLAMIFALHRLGDVTYSHQFEQTAVDPDPLIRGDTALMLGMLGEKSAIPILQQMLRSDKAPAVRLQAGEALWRLGDERGMDELIGATISRYPDDKMLALLALAQPRDTRVLGHIDSALTDEYPEVALVAARATGMLGTDRGYGVAMNGAQSVDARQRFLAAMAFGAIGRADAQPILAKLLRDTDTDVRVAAAGALLQIGKKG